MINERQPRQPNPVYQDPGKSSLCRRDSNLQKQKVGNLLNSPTGLIVRVSVADIGSNPALRINFHPNFRVAFCEIKPKIYPDRLRPSHVMRDLGVIFGVLIHRSERILCFITLKISFRNMDNQCCIYRLYRCADIHLTRGKECSRVLTNLWESTCLKS